MFETRDPQRTVGRVVARIPPNREVGSGAAEHVAALEPTSAEGQGPVLLDM
jgi:hypothetical protein